MAMALHNARKFAKAVKAKHAWTGEEVECAYILYLMIPVKRKQQRVDFLNVSFRNGRTYTAFEDRIRKIRHAQNNYYGHLPVKYECWAGDVETALDTLSRLLGRTVVFEENTLWYREELIVLATISSGPSSLGRIQRRLQKSYHIQRGLDEIESQMARLQCSTRSASGALLYPSHTIWASHHQSQYMSHGRHTPVAAGDAVATRIPNPGIRYLASAIRGNEFALGVLSLSRHSVLTLTSICKRWARLSSKLRR
ncbi:MAG: hypothetical protein Q9193_003823 [Seirophora villosa]